MKEEEKNTLPGISGPLLAWYSGNRRSLPWRDDPSAYHVWISEIMLQQTRVEAVKGYYARFLERFPDIRALAEADEDTCLKLWEGLGYYSRARNLQKAARLLVADYGGEMPRHSGELRKLPGIGPYTAAAIASIAFGERIPAIDGNLLRVFSRLALYEEEIRKPAAAAAAEAFFLEQMPAKKARGIEKRTILVIRDDDRILLRRRPGRGLLAGLYEFPGESGWLSEEEAVQKAREYGCDPLRIRLLPAAKHIFTHKEWHMHGYEIRIGSFSGDAEGGAEGDAAPGGQCFTAPIRDLQEKYALPSAYSAYFPE